ncbi:glycoside hydrolase family 19 protein [Luteimonas salinilitoris]|uniref:Glycoside hydrolase family 19 protein n=1 Tax=Luteimonas salinilitoris TaxID=3237697 RepID=A0ABV4HLZ5_9GAMM
MSNGNEAPESLKKFVYPFPKTDASNPDDPKIVEIDDPQVYYDALAKAEDGFYPIGVNGQWHGGIHFGSQTGTALSQDGGVRCIADGEVIAWRIDGDKYPEVEYETCKAAKYSSGFALVRHRLQLPAAPANSGDASTEAATAPAAPQPVALPAEGPVLPDRPLPPDAAPGAPQQGAAAREEPQAPAQSQSSTAASEQPSMVFYSLYMHLLYWKGYQDDDKKKRPAYWGEPVYSVGEDANDSRQNHPDNPHIPEDGVGLNLRDASGGYCGFAPRGTKLRLGAESANKGYYTVTEIVGGQTTPAEISGATAYKKELTPAAAEPATKDSIAIPDTPIPAKAGDLMGYLGEYQRYGDMNPLATSCTGRPLAQVDVFTHEDIDEFIKKSRDRDKELDAKQKTLLVVEPGATLVVPAESDLQLGAGESVAPTADSPKTGEWVKVRKGALQIVSKATLNGYSTDTRTYGGGQTLSMVVGTTDTDKITVEAYNALTPEQKENYPRREVLPAGGTEAWARRSQVAETGASSTATSLWNRFPLQVAGANGPQAGFLRVRQIKLLEKSAAEEDGTRWWEIDVGTADGSSRTGWAREKDHANVTLCSPWAWPGFEIVKGETSTPAQLYARHVVQQRQATPSEEGELAAEGEPVDTRPVFSKLYDIIDQADGGKEKDGHLSPQEIRKALARPWLAQAISRLIVEYENEWSGPMSKWDEIDQHIPEERKADWTQEKSRIKSLTWWDDVKGKHGFPQVSKANHFHPVGLVGNFFKSGLTCKTCGRSILLSFDFMRKVAGSEAKDKFLTEFSELSGELLTKYEVNTCSQIKHLLAQGKHETKRFTAFRESLYYSSYTAESLYAMAPTAINNGFVRKGLTFETNKDKIDYIEDNLLKNDAGYGQHCFGSNKFPNKDYRGRGLLHLTHFETYENYAKEVGHPIDSNPELVETKTAVIMETGLWYWKKHSIGTIADNPSYAGDAAVKRVTYPINPGYKGLAERQRFMREISKIFEDEFGECIR